MDRRIKQAWLVFACVQVFVIFAVSFILGKFICLDNPAVVLVLSCGLTYFIITFRRTLKEL